MSEEIIKILLWAPYGAHLHSGGAGINAFNLYNNRIKEVCHITLAHGSLTQTITPVFDDIQFIARLDKPSTVLNHISFLKAARHWLKSNVHNYDIFHGIDTFESTISPAYWAQKIGLPAVVKPASINSGLAPTRGWRKLFRRPQRRKIMINSLSGVIAISSAIENDLLAKGISHQILVRIPNGVDTKRFFPAASLSEKIKIRYELGWSEDSLILLCVAGLRPIKRVEWLIEALGKVALKSKKLCVAIVGSEKFPAYIDGLKRLANERNVMHRVFFHGHTLDIEKFYKASDMFCLSSVYEGMSNSLLEAMSSAIPCLVTRISGSEDLIRDGQNGYFINDPSELAEKLIALEANPPLRAKLGTTARQDVIEKYSVETVWHKYYELFKKVRKPRFATFP